MIRAAPHDHDVYTYEGAVGFEPEARQAFIALEPGVNDVFSSANGQRPTQ